jgi:uncharacterized Tic20 family protein
MMSIETNSQESKNIALLIWIGTLFFGFIPSLIVYFVKKDDAYILDQSKEALNWSITGLIIYIFGVITSFIMIGLVILPILGIVHIVFCIMGAIAATKGQEFAVPFALRLIK